MKAHTPENRHARRASQATCRGFDSWASAVEELGLELGRMGEKRREGEGVEVEENGPQQRRRWICA